MTKPGRRVLVGSLAIAAIMAGGWWYVARPYLDPLAPGRSAYERGEWEEASKSASGRLKGAPDDREALRLLARSYARAGRDPAAQRIFLRLDPNSWQAEDFLLLAAGLLRQGRTEVAWNTLLNGWKADPSHPEVLERLARLSLDAGRPLQAAEYARRLADLPRRAARGGLMLAEALRDADEPGGEAAALEKAFRSDPAPVGTGAATEVARKQWARSLLRLGRPVEARRQLEISSRAGVDREVDWLLSRAFLQEGAIAEATRSLARGGPPADDPIRPEPAPFVGAATCVDCHVEISRSQRAGRHAATIASGPELRSVLPPDRPIRDPILAGTEHKLRREGDRLVYETTTEGRLLRASVDYVLGSGRHGQTFMGADASGRVRELRISNYEGGKTWDLTTGQDPHPNRVGERLGRPIDDDELRRCLGCHTTRTTLRGGRPAPDALDRGIRCEQCHGPGGHHLMAVAANFPDPAIARPRLATAEKIVGLCGRCHGLPAGMPPPSGPIAARSQAAGLKLSACYRKSQGALSCVSCHDPHRDAERSPAFYEARCLSCHGPGPASGPDRRDEKPQRLAPCPVNPAAGCVGCHMPSVVGPSRHTSFSDHDIRVHRPEDLRSGAR